MVNICLLILNIKKIIVTYTYTHIYTYLYTYYRHETSLSASCKIATLSEYQVCREILWMFCAQTSMVVFQQENESKFSIRPDISIPSLTTVCIYFQNFLVTFFCTLSRKSNYIDSLQYYLNVIFRLLLKVFYHHSVNAFQ